MPTENYIANSTDPEISLSPVHVPLGDEIVEADHEDHGLEDVVQEPVEVEIAARVVGNGHNQADAKIECSRAGVLLFNLVA